MRVYIPVTLAMLQGLVADGSLHARSGTAFAVTPTLRESYAEGDDDELAEVALREAALASLRLLAIEGSGDESGFPVRRAVLVADVSDATDRPDLDDAVVRLAGPVGVSEVIAAYVDNSSAESAVAAARTALAYSRDKDEMYVFQGGSYTPDQIQDLFRGLGSDTAILLDGGGSSAIVLRRDVGGMWAGAGVPKGSCDTYQVLCDSRERALPSWLAFS